MSRFNQIKPTRRNFLKLLSITPIMPIYDLVYPSQFSIWKEGIEFRFIDLDRQDDPDVQRYQYSYQLIEKTHWITAKMSLREPYLVALGFDPYNFSTIVMGHQDIYKDQDYIIDYALKEAREHIQGQVNVLYTDNNVICYHYPHIKENKKYET